MKPIKFVEKKLVRKFTPLSFTDNTLWAVL